MQIRSVAREQTGHLMKAPPYSETLPAGQPQPINQDSDSPRRTYVSYFNTCVNTLHEIANVSKLAKRI